jgi:hypothetical protein
LSITGLRLNALAEASVHQEGLIGAASGIRRVGIGDYFSLHRDLAVLHKIQVLESSALSVGPILISTAAAASLLSATLLSPTLAVGLWVAAASKPASALAAAPLSPSAKTTARSVGIASLLTGVRRGWVRRRGSRCDCLGGRKRGMRLELKIEDERGGRRSGLSLQWFESEHRHGEPAGGGGQPADFEIAGVVSDGGDLLAGAIGRDRGARNGLTAGADTAILRLGDCQSGKSNNQPRSAQHARILLQVRTTRALALLPVHPRTVCFSIADGHPKSSHQRNLSSIS